MNELPKFELTQHEWAVLSEALPENAITVQHVEDARDDLTAAVEQIVAARLRGLVAGVEGVRLW